MNDCQFKVGDKLDSIFGPCEVVEILEGNRYPIMTVFRRNDKTRYLTKDGKISEEDSYPIVWFPETGSPPVVGERPKWKPKKPTWCWVWDDEGDESIWPVLIRLEDGEYVTNTPEGFMTFAKVEPCKPEEIPSWWPKEWG